MKLHCFSSLLFLALTSPKSLQRPSSRLTLIILQQPLLFPPHRGCNFSEKPFLLGLIHYCYKHLLKTSAGNSTMFLTLSYTTVIKDVILKHMLIRKKNNLYGDLYNNWTRIKEETLFVRCFDMLIV